MIGLAPAPATAYLLRMAPPTPSEPQSPDRFHEDRASYTLRGSDQPDIHAGAAAIREVLGTLPARPGVYRMLDARGDVLYVGQA